jgi:hypothetical protein
MVSAINSSASPGPASAGLSVAGLQAQLDRYQKQLSDCVNCDSANTREGRETIQALSNKISQVKSRIEEISATKSNTPPAAPNPAGATANVDAHASGTTGNSAVATAPGPAAAGSRLDVFA